MKGCLLRVLLLPLTICSLYPLLLLRFPFPTIVFPAEGAEATTVIGGLFVWFALISFLDLRQLNTDRILINKGVLRDGEKVVVSGRLRPEGPLLQAPFSGRDCVGYYYKISRLVSSSGSTSGSSRWTYYEGCGLISAVIKGPLGKMKILAEADKELFYEVPLVKVVDKIEQARNFIQSCPVEKSYNGLGEFQLNKIFGEPEEFEKCDFEEGLIRKEEVVLVSGVYSEEGGGIKADPDTIMRPFHIIPGGGDAIKRKVRNRFIGISICLIGSTVTLSVYYLMYGKATTW